MLLNGLRVVDLTDHRGEIGPWYLAVLGAEVTRVEPAPGSSARHEPPRLPGPPGPLQSLQFRAYNDGKGSVAAPPSTPDGRRTVLDLVAGADLVFESGLPGTLAAYELTHDDLVSVNERIVHVLVSPFGADGPRARQPWSELTVAALGGPMSLQGVPERAPVKVSIPQVWRHAGMEAAVGALIALRRADQLGSAQFVDVSAQAAMTWTMLNAMEAHAVQGFDFVRSGLTLQLAVRQQLGHRAADGYCIQAPAGITAGPLMPWLVEEGIAPPSWLEQDWTTYDHRFLSGAIAAPTYDEISAAIDELCARYPRHDLLERGLRMGATIAPVNTIPDLLTFAHLEARGFWDRRTEPDGQVVRWPGAPVTIDGVRPPRPRGLAQPGDGPVPTTGPRPRPSAGPAPADALPLHGIKVADFSWVGVGPITARCLADHGATVVRIESEKRLDTLRAQAPFKDAEFGINRSNFFGSFNTSKLSMSLDLTTDAGREVARHLVGWADVVIDSFRPGVMERMGLGPADVARLNPRAVTVTTSLLGGGGPMSSLAGYGFHAGALAGFTDLVGWPDLPPDGPWMAYTDTIGPRFLITAILAALDRRARTGRGGHLEGAQLEMALHFMTPELLDHQLTGRTAQRMGNRDPHLAPQGVYRCSGDDEWCAMTVADDSQWARLVELLGRPEWALAAELSTSAGRADAHDRLDEHLSTWTAERTPEEVEQLLCSAGIAAGKVARSRDLLVDPQHTHRRFYRVLEHAEVGPVPYAGHQFRIAGYDSGPRFAAPTLGEHSYQVLTELLGLDDDAAAALIARGALG